MINRADCDLAGVIVKAINIGLEHRAVEEVIISIESIMVGLITASPWPDISRGTEDYCKQMSVVKIKTQGWLQFLGSLNFATKQRLFLENMTLATLQAVSLQTSDNDHKNCTPAEWRLECCRVLQSASQVIYKDIAGVESWKWPGSSRQLQGKFAYLLSLLQVSNSSDKNKWNSFSKR